MMRLWGNSKFSPNASSVPILFYTLKPDIFRVEYCQRISQHLLKPTKTFFICCLNLGKCDFNFEGQKKRFRIIPKPFFLLVAGGGFEPPTFGL
jgi:hypothetical protein